MFICIPEWQSQSELRECLVRSIMSISWDITGCSEWCSLVQPDPLRKSPPAESLVKARDNDCNGKVTQTWFQMDF
jgi:hypothetical protein